MSGIVLCGLILAATAVLCACSSAWAATDPKVLQTAAGVAGREGRAADLSADVERALTEGLLAGHLDSDLYRDAMADLARRPRDAADAYRARGGFVSG
jgi:hypothetical protein